jgi:uncharacterized membrane protein
MIRPPLLRPAVRVLLAAFYVSAGLAHLRNPAPFVQITPDWVPYPQAVVWWTGVAELAGAAALAQPFSAKLIRAGGIGLALYALCVWPANINHMVMDLARDDMGWGLGYHIPRMIAQPLLIWLALWSSGTIRWPFTRAL